MRQGCTSVGTQKLPIPGIALVPATNTSASTETSTNHQPFGSFEMESIGGWVLSKSDSTKASRNTPRYAPCAPATCNGGTSHLFPIALSNSCSPSCWPGRTWNPSTIQTHRLPWDSTVGPPFGEMVLPRKAPEPQWRDTTSMHWASDKCCKHKQNRWQHVTVCPSASG